MSKSRVIVAVLALTGVSVSVMQTLVIPLLPHLPTILDAAPDDTSWVLTITLLVGAVSTPIAGRLGDMIGKKRMLLICVSTMIIGSTICALSSSLVPMLVGRAFQGAAIGSISLGISLMRDVLPRERLGGAIALMSATLGIGGAVGLPVAAVVAEKASWHALFYGSAVLGLAAFVSIALLTPESHIRTRDKFDYAGALGLSVLLIALLVALTKSHTWGWSSPLTLGLLAGSALMFIAWVAFERRSDHPLVDIQVSRRPAVLFTNLASVMVGFAVYSQNLVLTQLLQLPEPFGFAQSMAVAGLCAAPSGLMMILLSPVAARIIARRGPKFCFSIGLSVIALAFTFGIFFLQHVWETIILATLIGSGIALSYAAMPTLIMRSVPQTQTAAANSVNTLSRSLGTSLASAILGAVLAGTLIGRPTTFGPMNAFQMCFLLAVIACALAALFLHFVPSAVSRPRRGQPVPEVRITDEDALADIEGIEPEPSRVAPAPSLR